MLLAFIEMPLVSGGHVIINVEHIDFIIPNEGNDRQTVLQIGQGFVIVAIPFDVVRVKVYELTKQLWEGVRQK